MERYTPSVVAYVVWHPSFTRGAGLAKELFKLLNRDLEDPEARAIGIPTCFRSAPLTGGKLPPEISSIPGTLSFVILLVDRGMVEDPHWGGYIKDLLARLPVGHVLPCVFTSVPFEGVPRFATLNTVRLQDSKVPEPEQCRRMLHEVTHALSRLLLDVAPAPGSKLPPPAVSLFVSHAKRDGVHFAEALRNYIVTQSQHDAFFDSNHIAPGFPFDVQIFSGAARSALIVIQTDAYSSREWCRREVIEAKRHARPIVVLNAVQQGEDRSFPYLGNVPSRRWAPPPEDPGDPAKSAERQKQALQEMCRTLVEVTLREVLRAAYFKREVEQLKALYPVLKGAQALPRPPELLTAARPAPDAPAPTVIYPDPPIGDEELEIIAPHHGLAVTPVLLPASQHGAKPQEPVLSEWTVGISIGNPSLEDLVARGLSDENLREVAIECARYLLTYGARLGYGGDLRPGGFTEQLIGLVYRHNRAGSTPYKRLSNYLAWPVHSGLPEDSEEKAASVRTIRVPLPADLSAGSPDPGDAYTKARCMTAMREQMTTDIRARVLLGGKLDGYTGRWPGIVEEAYLALKAKKAVFLIGGFGGAAGWLAQVVRTQTRALPPELQAYQQKRGALRDAYARDGRTGLDGVDLSEALAFFEQVTPSDFHNGLEPEEHEVLMRSTHLVEILALLVQGFIRLART